MTKVTIRTTDGESRTVEVKPEDVRATEELPFSSSNVSSTTVHPD